MSWKDGVTIRGAAVDGSVESIRFRQPLRQLLLGLLFVPIGMLFGGLASGSLFTVVAHPAAFFAPAIGVPVVGLVGFVVNGTRAVSLTRDALVVERIGGHRTIPWSEIEGFTIRELLGAKQIMVHRVKGRRVRLGAPIGGFLGDRDFDRKYHTIGQWWLTCR
ncbi:hypothetical protein [Streptacidiphilus sp. EB103A]|uniref:hypothetical protein n=1 Tax=Streptacidiphilus sp. EB103A TaxID=3156275 RepID=UPI003513FAED